MFLVDRIISAKSISSDDEVDYIDDDRGLLIAKCAPQSSAFERNWNYSGRVTVGIPDRSQEPGGHQRQIRLVRQQRERSIDFLDELQRDIAPGDARESCIQRVTF